MALYYTLRLGIVVLNALFILPGLFSVCVCVWGEVLIIVAFGVSIWILELFI